MQLNFYEIFLYLFEQNLTKKTKFLIADKHYEIQLKFIKCVSKLCIFYETLYLFLFCDKLYVTDISCVAIYN